MLSKLKNLFQKKKDFVDEIAEIESVIGLLTKRQQKWLLSSLTKSVKTTKFAIHYRTNISFMVGGLKMIAEAKHETSSVPYVSLITMVLMRKKGEIE